MCETRVRKDGAFENRPGDGLAWAGFLHTTARPVPGSAARSASALAHVLLQRHARPGRRRRIKAAEFANIYRDRPFYEAVFYSLVAEDFAEARLADRAAGRRQMGSGRAATDGRDVLQADRRNRGRGQAARHHRCRPQGGAGGEDALEETQGADARRSCARHGMPS